MNGLSCSFVDIAPDMAEHSRYTFVQRATRFEIAPRARFGQIALYLSA
jgi:hypothetical protein